MSAQLTIVLVSAVNSRFASLEAQVLYGSVVGTVLDESKTSVPGATVRLVNEGTKQSREAVTAQDGANIHRRQRIKLPTRNPDDTPPRPDWRK